MTQGFFQSLINRGNNALDKLGNALFGVYPSSSVTTYSNNGYTQAQNDYLNSLDNEDYFKNLISGPKQTTLTPQQYKDGVMQGLNFGIPQIAQKQKELNINIPQTGEDIENARIGEFNQYPVINGSVTSGKRQGGIFNDIAEGYKDNYNNRFSFENWQPENKSLANRIGEGLGTLRRFIDSPLARGLLMAGIVGGTGGSGLDAITYGLTSGIGRQNIMTADKLYRNQLKQYGFTDDDLNQIRGNITSDMYKNLTNNLYRTRNLDQNTYVKMRNAYDKQLQAGILSPEDYKANIEALNSQYINSQIQTMNAGNVGVSNQTRNTDMNEQLLPYKQYAMQVSPQVALGNLGIAQGNLGINNARLQETMEQNDFNNAIKLEELQDKRNENKNNFDDVEKQLNNFEDMFNKVPNKLSGATTGALRRMVGLASENEANFDAQRTLLFNQIARKIGDEKGVLSDQDIKRIDKALPTLSDSYTQRKAKMKAVYDLLDIKKGTSTQNITNINVDRNALEAELRRRGLK